MSKNYGAAGPTSRRGQAYLLVQRVGNMKGSSPRPSVKAAAANEHATVTLDDIKSVALDSMLEVEEMRKALQECDRYIVYNYNNCELTGSHLENSPKIHALIGKTCVSTVYLEVHIVF